MVLNKNLFLRFAAGLDRPANGAVGLEPLLCPKAATGWFDAVFVRATTPHEGEDLIVIEPLYY